MSKLFDFLTDLATNPRQQEVFAKNPDAAIAQVGLSESDRAVLLSRNSAQIAATFADELFQAAIFIVEPAPDPLPDPDPPEPDTPDSDNPKEEKLALARQHA